MKRVKERVHREEREKRREERERDDSQTESLRENKT